MGRPSRQDLPEIAAMAGARFGRWTVTSSPTQHMTRREAMVECVCDCGVTKLQSAYRLRSGGTQSCGCLSAEKSRERKTRLKHGHAPDAGRSPEYQSWGAMVRRCTNKNNQAFYAYGGRGIGVCERWLSFESFLADMGPRPHGTTIDRIDNDRGYEPGNCRWGTSEQQNNNRRSNVRVEWGGVTRTVAEWARLYGIDCGVLHQRIRLGWEMGRALTQPVKKSRRAA